MNVFTYLQIRSGFSYISNVSIVLRYVLFRICVSVRKWCDLDYIF